MRDKLEALRAAGQEKNRVIADLRAQLEDERQTVLELTQKLKHFLDKQDERPVVRISAVEERINTQIAKLNDLYRRIDDRISTVVNNTSAQLYAHKVAIEGNTSQIGEIKEGIAGLAREMAKQVTDLKSIVDRNARMEKPADETQRIEASRHEALRQRVEKIEQVVPPGSGNLQTIVENLADRMAADPKNAFQTYVDQRIQRISSWFDTKLSSIAEQFRGQRVAHTALQDRVVVTERKIAALEGSDNTLFDDLQNQIDQLTAALHDVQKNNPTPVETARALNDMTLRQKGLFDRMDVLQARTHGNTVDLHNLSARITKLEE